MVQGNIANETMCIQKNLQKCYKKAGLGTN